MAFERALKEGHNPTLHPGTALGVSLGHGWLTLTSEEPGNEPQRDVELLESFFVELDPLEDGFTGVLLEVHRQGYRYVLLEPASTTGNRLLRFSLKKGSIYATFASELDGSIQ